MRYASDIICTDMLQISFVQKIKQYTLRSVMSFPKIMAFMKECGTVWLGKTGHT
jgi:hypothetical protein